METETRKDVGVWIDNRRAVIVTIVNEVSGIQEIRSNIEKHTRASGAPPSKTKKDAQELTSEAGDEEQVENPLGRYFEGVISFIRDADAIWIIGPGETKRELEKSLRLAGLGDHIVGVATLGKMTDAQISVKVRSRFYKYLIISTGLQE